MTKPVVHYKVMAMQYIPTEAQLQDPIAYKGAIVWPTDHANHVLGQRVSNLTVCYTSKVVRVGEDGEFETLNTIYKPLEDKDEQAPNA